jgi:hypothetical protein
MLGHLRMNVNEAIDALLEVALSVFPEGSQQTSDPETNSRNLKMSIERLLQARGLPPDTKMVDRSRPSMRCNVYVFVLLLISFFKLPQRSLCGKYNQYQSCSGIPYIFFSWIQPQPHHHRSYLRNHLYPSLFFTNKDWTTKEAPKF